MKPSIYSQVYLHFVFSPRHRGSLLREEIQPEVFSYINGTIKNKGSKPIAVNGMPDHVHIFIGANTAISMNDLVRDIKRSSSLFINGKKLTKVKFAWQEGFGVFSYSRSHIDKVYHYIMNQKSHHLKATFRMEYLELLNKYAVDFDDRYLFEFFE